ncbi:16S rRNA (uracil(1498)-N(3))-methyltransferase [Candidatus Falkowbacteria bacterium]|nr:16S rRNA (uracil(1498)-N(3))-methyltransferase [Candidatus Falkowbacteria bacterium]
MQRFFLNTTIENPQKIVIKDKEIVKKIIKVLRKQIGDTIFIFDSTNEEYEVQITAIINKEVICRLVSRVEINRELPAEINLYQALLKKDKLEWICQKATEIGVKNINPVISENCIVKELNKNKAERYQKIINEATIQCGGKIPPKFSKLIAFNQLIEKLNPNELNLIAHEDEKENKLIDVLKKCPVSKINILIGPEGGFSPEEVSLALRNSVIPISLGKRILRAETAAIVACSLISQLYA